MCCKWDGCNRDLQSANMTSRQYETRLMEEILGSESDQFNIGASVLNRRTAANGQQQLGISAQLLLNYLANNQGTLMTQHAMTTQPQPVMSEKSRLADEATIPNNRLSVGGRGNQFQQHDNTG